MSRTHSVRESVPTVPGDGAESCSHEAESPLFFDRLSDYQIGGASVFAGVHEGHDWGVCQAGVGGPLSLYCHDCEVGRVYTADGLTLVGSSEPPVQLDLLRGGE